MRHKKSDTGSTEESELEKRVDRMMDPRQPDGIADDAATAEPETTSDAKAADTPPPIDIFKDASTAPDVPKAVLDEVGLGDKDEDNNSDNNQEDAAAKEPASDKDTSTGRVTNSDVPAEASDNESVEAGVPDVDTSGEPFSDAKTDAAVADITKHDSDKLLEIEDIEKAEATGTKATKAHNNFFAKAFKKWWVWVIAVLVVLGVLYAVPFTRYHIAGLLMKQTYDVTVLDSTTHTMVSGATVTLNGKTATTDAKGVAEFSVPVGHHQLQVQEKYYKKYNADVLVPLWSKGNTTINLVATGRQVPVTVINKITGQPVADATVRALDTKATTDKDGKAVIVLPLGKATQAGKVQADGYNTANVTVQVTSKTVSGNTFAVTPAGRMYFLSNLDGNLDVVSTNLDGSNRLTVLAGTGSEDPDNTILMASRDWKYLALVSKRDGGDNAKVFLINTASSNKLTTIDNSVADFSPIGWQDHYFLYMVNRPNVPSWQSGAISIESYNADTGKLVTLASSQATGTSNSDAEYQSIWNTAVLGGKVVYATTWYQYPGYLNVSDKQNQLVMIAPDGTGKKVISSVNAATSYFGTVAKVQPQEALVKVSTVSNSGMTFYTLKTDGTYTQTTDSKLISPSVSRSVYLVSPDGTKTFWTEGRDGKNVLFVGDANAQSPKTVATLSTDYTAYGWYTDNYLLVSYKGSELFVLPAIGLKGDQQPLKITDYYKPDYGLNGYGYGGGL